MPYTLSDDDWRLLLKRIYKGKCTPFLGAGVCAGTLPLGAEIARKWANEFNYPIKNCNDLVRVAQFLAVKKDPMFPKEEIAELFENVEPPNFNKSDEPHNFLSELPLPIYMTTNYDDFMTQALKKKNKDPHREFCLWNEHIKEQPSIFESDFVPSPANPVVFHLHGITEITESLVLTEDDYLDFLVNISEDPEILPSRIQKALTGASLIFIGYRLEDWDFRVLFRGLVTSKEKSLRRISVTVQLPPEQKGLRNYLEKYFSNMGMKVYWGTAKEFVNELKNRWRDYSHDK